MWKETGGEGVQHILWEDPPDAAQVLLAHVAVADLCKEALGGLLGAGKQQHARGQAVEPVHRCRESPRIK
jgi:hypothetical protein